MQFKIFDNNLIARACMKRDVILKVSGKGRETESK